MSDNIIPDFWTCYSYLL